VRKQAATERVGRGHKVRHEKRTQFEPKPKKAEKKRRHRGGSLKERKEQQDFY